MHALTRLVPHGSRQKNGWHIRIGLVTCVVEDELAVTHEDGTISCSQPSLLPDMTRYPGWTDCLHALSEKPLQRAPTSPLIKDSDMADALIPPFTSLTEPIQTAFRASAPRGKVVSDAMSGWMKGKPLTADHWRVRAAFAQVLGMDDGASWEDIGRRMKPSMRDSQQDALPAPHGDRSDRHADMPTRASGITEQPASTSDSSSAPSKPSAGTPVFSQTRLRYQILMADGTHPDPKAEFFVLRMDPGAGDPHHREASLDGLAMYVRTLQDHHPGLAAEIQALYPGLLGRLKTYEASQETPAGKESEPLRESDGDTSTPGDGADEVIGFIKRGFSAFKDIAMQLLDARLPDQGAISPHAVPGLKSSMRPMMIEMGVPPHLADRWMDAKILDIRPLIRAHLQRSEEPDVSDATCLFIWHVLLAYGAVVSSDPFQ